MNCSKLRTCLIMAVSVFVAMTDLAFAQPTRPVISSAARDIETLLNEQTKCWNDKDIEGFMTTYWNSEHLAFSGGGKTTRGWQATMDRYKTSYPAEKMGKLTIDHQEVSMLGSDAALVLGQWHLDNKSEQKEGNFSLVLRKMPDGWKIIHDHSSTLEKPKADDREKGIQDDK